MVAYFFVTQLSLGSVCYLYRLHVICKIKDKFQTFRKNFLTFHAFSKILSVISST